jgi:hypothetical protein
MKNVFDLWNLCPLSISYSRKHSMTNDERMPRESGLIATIRKELPEFAKRARMTRNLCCFTKSAWEKSAGDREKSKHARRRRHDPVNAIAPVQLNRPHRRQCYNRSPEHSRAIH